MSTNISASKRSRRMATDRGRALQRFAEWDEAGVTLIEFVAASIAMLALGAVLWTLYTTMANAVEIAEVKSLVTGSLRNAMEQIGRDIQKAREDITSVCGDYDGYKWNVNPGYEFINQQISLRLKATSNSPGESVIYQCSADDGCTSIKPGEILRIVDTDCSIANGNQTRVLARNVTTLAFDRWNGLPGDQMLRYGVTIGVTARVRPNGFQYSSSLTDLVTFRNMSK